MVSRTLCLIALVASTVGCYSHVYHVRRAEHPYAEVAIDRNKPHSSTKWGTWWGIGYVWEPIGCYYEEPTPTTIPEGHTVDGQDADARCKQYFALCENGVGRVEVQPAFEWSWVSILSFGALYAANMTAYCATDSEPDDATGPDEPSGPDGPSGPDDEDPSADRNEASSNGEAYARAVH